MSRNFEKRILVVLTLCFGCTILLILHGNFQAPNGGDGFERVVDELDKLEKTLRKEREELEELDRVISRKLRSHPHAGVAAAKRVGRLETWREPIPVLVFACNRPDALREHLRKLFRFRINAQQFPIIVSQDCDNRALRTVVEEFGDSVQYIKHISSETARLKIPQEHRHFAVYYKIARHYKLALGRIFDELNHSSVIITEDDLDVAPDFFNYFLATRPLLEEDNSLFCVSAWNDNGVPEFVDVEARELLYRSDFFSGLGWMLTKRFWEEVKSRWPEGFWDDFIREPEQRRNRSCIRPELSRTAMTDFGQRGASGGLFFNRHLKRILPNRRPVDFAKIDMSTLFKSKYDVNFISRAYSLPKISVQELLLNNGSIGGEFRVEYESMDKYLEIAKKIGIMADTKAGVPRTAYRGIVSFFLKGKRVFVVPSNREDWNGYDTKWEAPRDVLDGQLR